MNSQFYEEIARKIQTQKNELQNINEPLPFSNWYHVTDSCLIKYFGKEHELYLQFKNSQTADISKRTYDRDFANYKWHIGVVLDRCAESARKGFIQLPEDLRESNLNNSLTRIEVVIPKTNINNPLPTVKSKGWFSICSIWAMNNIWALILGVLGSIIAYFLTKGM